MASFLYVFQESLIGFHGGNGVNVKDELFVNQLSRPGGGFI
jgi:hypothetical protein